MNRVDRELFWCTVGAGLAMLLMLSSCATTQPAVESGSSGAPQAAAAPTGAAGVSPGGVFTSQQASRGEQSFTNICARCHGLPEFTSTGFRRAWSRRTVLDFYQVISTTMPQSNPGGLSAQEYSDIIAFFLSRNGHTAGQRELTPDPAVLGSITFEPAP